MTLETTTIGTDGSHQYLAAEYTSVVTGNCRIDIDTRGVQSPEVRIKIGELNWVGTFAQLKEMLITSRP